MATVSVAAVQGLRHGVEHHNYSAAVLSSLLSKRAPTPPLASSLTPTPTRPPTLTPTPTPNPNPTPNPCANPKPNPNPKREQARP